MSSCILSHLVLGNGLSSLVMGIYGYCRAIAWLYCKVLAKNTIFRKLGMCAHQIPRFILPVSFSDTLLVVSILDIV